MSSKALTSYIAGLLAAVLAYSAANAQDQLLQGRDAVHWTNIPRQVLAFYYGWYGNPTTSGHWVHRENVNERTKTIGNSTHYPTLGPYDSHDTKLIEQHCR